MPPCALGDVRERILLPRPSSEALGPEAVGIRERSRIVTGAVQVEDRPVADPEIMALEPERDTHSPRHHREEREEAPHLLDERLEIRLLSGGELLPPLRVPHQRDRGELDEAGDGQQRPQEVQQLHACDLRREHGSILGMAR